MSNPQISSIRLKGDTVTTVPTWSRTQFAGELELCKWVICQQLRENRGPLPPAVMVLRTRTHGQLTSHIYNLHVYIYIYLYMCFTTHTMKTENISLYICICTDGAQDSAVFQPGYGRGVGLRGKA